MAALLELNGPANMPPVTFASNDKPRPQNVDVGDLVQVETNGAFHLDRPARVRAIYDHEGQTRVFIDGSNRGVSMEQIVLQAKG